MSVIDNTWLAFAFDREAAPDRVGAGLGRVAAHYSEQYGDPLVGHACGDGLAGMALWHRQDGRLRWSPWAEGGELSVATTHAPTSCEELLSLDDPRAAALGLGRRIRDHPRGLKDLNPPFMLAVHDGAAASLTIVNDFLAAARLFELRTAEGWVWSNRLGALPLFAGSRPQLDSDAWAIHAATGWFLSRTTPIRNAVKVAQGSVIKVACEHGITRVSRRQTDAIKELVEPRRARLQPHAREAAQQALALARGIDSLWRSPVTVNFSGGRDSRVSAGAAVAAGMAARFRTKDIEPGEADLVRELVAKAPRPMSHSVVPLEQGEPGDDLNDRLRVLHLLHDGVANPMAALGPAPGLPWTKFPSPLITGHGGELGHGFYYSGTPMRRLRGGGTAALVERLERSGRQKHGAARDHAYGAYLSVIRETLEEGRSYGVDGPSLLDYFYLAQRLPFRFGLGARNDRYSACLTPAFVRGCFDLTPRQRLGARFHRAVIGSLVPEWKRVPFFKAGGGRMRPMKRDRIWEKPRHSAQLEQMLERDSIWSDWFLAPRLRDMWVAAKQGEGHSHFESIFMRVAWRVSFEDHLSLLADRAEAAHSYLGSSVPQCSGSWPGTITAWG